jgi:predicted acylesterase/phospholipase RssA
VGAARASAAVPHYFPPEEIQIGNRQFLFVMAA